MFKQKEREFRLGPNGRPPLMQERVDNSIRFVNVAIIVDIVFVFARVCLI